MEKKKVIKKKKGKSLFSRIVAWVHLWPSIVAGIIVVFVSLTGTIIVYGDEIMNYTAGDAKYVEVPQNAKRVTHQQLMKNIHDFNPALKVSEFVIFKDLKRSIRVRAFNPEAKKLAYVYVNPYSGKVIKVDETIYFFFVMAHLHSALLAGKVGGWIVAISTIVFVISTLTGLILWWPKRWNKTTRQASFTIKWKARFKRFNYDLHNVYGFYSLIVCFILGMTGLIIFFHPMMELTIKSTGGSIEHMDDILPKMDSTRTSKDMIPFAFEILEKEFPEKPSVSIWNFDQQKMGAFVFTSGTAGLKSRENADISVFDRYSGKKIEIDKKYLRHESTENIVWQLHMGQWWGQLGKLSTFLAGIIATSLPITGFLIWWGRRNKKGKKSKEVKNIHQNRKEVHHDKNI